MNNKKTWISIGAVAAVAAGIFGVAAMSKKDSTPVETVPVSDTVTDVTPVADKPTTTKAPSTSTYKDGTYTATGSYRSPGGPDEIGVTVQLRNDIVTSVSITPMPHDPTSVEYQAKFASGYKAYVVGKDIDSVKLGAVSGSSLTGIGFNDAIAKIKVKAKA
ncbi:MAG: FMN-binding protein [Candidatus Nomurabacteria bacterium]|nr:FMN-binding protein [Candidatus Nomurabacteria bacterium]